MSTSKILTPEEAETLWQMGVAISYSSDYIEKQTVVKSAESKQGPIWVKWCKLVGDEHPVLEVEVE